MKQDRILDMQALRVFLMTAETRNMSLVAQELGISQPAVSQAIRGLEAYFGTELLGRDSRPLELTPAGRSLYSRGGALLDETLNLKGVVRDASAEIKPDLRMGLVDSYATTCGPALIQHLLPKVGRLSIRTGLSPHLAQSLIRREFDLIVSSDPLADTSGVVRQRLATEQYFIIVPADCQVTVKNADDLGRLSDALPMIRFNSISHSGAQVDRLLRRLNLTVPNRLEVDTADTLVAMVKGGVGWALVTPLCLFQAGCAGQALRHIIIPDLPAHRSLYIVTRENELTQLTRYAHSVATAILQDHTLPELLRLDQRFNEVFKIES